MVAAIRKFALGPKLRLSLVWALLPAVLLVWFVYGIVGSIEYFRGWSLLHLFVWVWLTLSIPGILPGSLRETKANMSMLIAFAGFLLPLPAYLHQVFPVPGNAYLPEPPLTPATYAFFFTEPLWFGFSLALGLAIGIGGLWAYVALSSSVTAVDSQIEEDETSRQIKGALKNVSLFLLKILAVAVLAVLPPFVIWGFVNELEVSNPFRDGLSAQHSYIWVWTACTFLGLSPGSWKEGTARVCLLTGFAGILLPCVQYMNILFDSSWPYEGFSDTLFFIVAFYVILSAIFAGGGFFGYIALTHPETLKPKDPIIAVTSGRNGEVQDEHTD